MLAVEAGQAIFRARQEGGAADAGRLHRQARHRAAGTPAP
jgi:hypothetical protein